MRSGGPLEGVSMVQVARQGEPLKVVGERYGVSRQAVYSALQRADCLLLWQLAKDEQRRKRLVEKFIISAKEARARFVARAVEMGYHVEVMDRRYGAIRIEGVPFKVHTPRRIFRGVGLKHDGYLVVRIESGDVWHAVTLPTGSYWIVAPEKVKKGAIYLRLDKLNEMEEEWPSVEALKEWIRINVRGGEE